MTKNELSEAFDAFITKASRVWLTQWLKDNPKVPVLLPLAHGQSLMKEASTHKWVGQKLDASTHFKESLQMLEHGTTTIPQMQLETRMRSAILPSIETAGLA